MQALETILHNQFVVVSGISGSGKSTVVHHTALRMSESHGYLVVPRGNISQVYLREDTGLKIIYVMDDLFGNVSISDYDLFDLNWIFDNMKFIAARNPNCKFLITCRPNTISMSKIKDVLPSIVECNLHSPELTLTLNERRKICDLYLPEEIIVYQNDHILLQTEQLPLLCTLYKKHFCNSVQDFFLNADEIITSKIQAMRESESPSYICLAMLLIYGEDNTLLRLDESVTLEHKYIVLNSIISESRIKRTTFSRKMILAGWEALEGTYVRIDGVRLSFIHDKIYDIAVSCIGGRFINSILKYAEYSFIESRVRLELFATPENTQNACVILNQTYIETFFARLLKEVKRYNDRVFGNIQNKDQCYRKAFINHLKHHLTDSDLKYFIPQLVLLCKLGYQDFVSYIVEKWKKQLRTTQFKSETPLSVACSMGHFNIAKLLVESSIGKDVTDGSINRACQKGYTNIFELLLKHGIYFDLIKCFVDACENGQAEIVELFLGKKPKLLKSSLCCYGIVPLSSACTNGHEEVVDILLRHNVLVNNNNNSSAYTPLYLASMKGNLNIVKLLLNADAKISVHDIMVAEWNDHEDISKCLRRHLSLQSGNVQNRA